MLRVVRNDILHFRWQCKRWETLYWVTFVADSHLRLFNYGMESLALLWRTGGEPQGELRLEVQNSFGQWHRVASLPGDLNEAKEDIDRYAEAWFQQSQRLAQSV